MRYVSQTQPFCRCCGKPIKKFTVTHYFGERTFHADSDWAIYHPEKVMNKQEAQRFINQRIVGIRYGYNRNVMATVWDGETYTSIRYSAPLALGVWRPTCIQT